jgi:hypothetical protein
VSGIGADDRSFIDLLTQVSAIQAALDRSALGEAPRRSRYAMPRGACFGLGLRRGGKMNREETA